MRLDAWLKQPHSPAERLRLIERLAQALNTVHDRGEALASIAPERVEVGGDLKIDLSPAKRGRPEPGYAAPERLEGSEPSTAADIYSVGSLCWEVLVGRPCGEAPKPLSEIAPELSRELANSVMGCLERSSEWRPKDLTYLAQLAAAQQKAVRGPEPEPKPKRAAPPPRASAAPRTAPRRASRSQLPLLLAAVLLIAAAAASYLWLHRQQAEPSVAARATAPTPPAAAAPQPDPGATATPPPASAAFPTPVPTVTDAKPTPAPEIAAPMAEPEPAPTPEPTPTPVPTAAAAPPEPRTASAPPAEPASLSTVSPLSVKRPGKVLIDIRGAGLRADLRVRILALKENPRGIAVIRQKWTSPNLVSVLLELDSAVTPTVYAIALEDASGALTNTLQLHVTK